jgi:hypothetical protein
MGRAGRRTPAGAARFEGRFDVVSAADGQIPLLGSMIKIKQLSFAPAHPRVAQSRLPSGEMVQAELHWCFVAGGANYANNPKGLLR